MFDVFYSGSTKKKGGLLLSSGSKALVQKVNEYTASCGKKKERKVCLWLIKSVALEVKFQNKGMHVMTQYIKKRSHKTIRKRQKELISAFKAVRLIMGIQFSFGRVILFHRKRKKKKIPKKWATLLCLRKGCVGKKT